jgi:hypothetical protein
MRRLLSVTLATATAGLALTAAPAAHAAPARGATITSVTVKPALAVQSRVNKQTVNFEVRASGVADLDIDVQAHRGNGTVIVTNVKQTAPGSGVWRGSGFLYNWETAGAYDVDVTAYDADYNATTKHASFQVRKNTFVSGFKAGPSPIRRGKAITVSGQLKGLNTLGEYSGVKGQRVQILFKKKGTAKWVPYGTVTTGKAGKFAKRFKAKTSGYWVVRYAGTGWWNKSTSNGDGVVVR